MTPSKFIKMKITQELLNYRSRVLRWTGIHRLAVNRIISKRP